MAGETKKVDYVTGADGVRYKLVLAPESEHAEKPVVKKKRRRIFTKKFFIFLALLILLAGAGVFSYRFYLAKKELGPIPGNISKQVKFPLHYPRKLPEGFSLKPDSMQYADKILVFILSYDNGQELTVSEQAMPKDFATSLLSNSQSIETRLGTGYVGEYGLHPVGIITAKETLIFLNNPSITDDTKLREVIENF